MPTSPGCSFGPEALRWFSAIVTGDVVLRQKPSPDVYNVALAKLGVPAQRAIAFRNTSASSSWRHFTSQCCGRPEEVCRPNRLEEQLAILLKEDHRFCRRAALCGKCKTSNVCSSE